MQREYLAPDGKDRAKAATLVVLIHMMLGVLLVTGLALHLDRHHDTSLATFNVEPPPPPPELRSEKPAKAPRAPARKKAVPTPIVALPPTLPIKSPLAAAPIAGQGTASSAGSATSRTGTGAGGAGNGTGAGGNGTAVIGARLIAGSLDRRDYRQIAALGPSRGAAELLLLVNRTGRVERCRTLQSSGNPQIDVMLCQIMIDRALFSPAHAADGSRYYQDVHYFPRWGR